MLLGECAAQHFNDMSISRKPETYVCLYRTYTGLIWLTSIFRKTENQAKLNSIWHQTWLIHQPLYLDHSTIQLRVYTNWSTVCSTQYAEKCTHFTVVSLLNSVHCTQSVCNIPSSFKSEHVTIYTFKYISCVTCTAALFSQPLHLFPLPLN